MAKKSKKEKPKTYAFAVQDRVLWFDPDTTKPTVGLGKLGMIVKVDVAPGVTDYPAETVLTVALDDGNEAKVTAIELRRPEPSEDGLQARIESGYYHHHRWPEKPVKPRRLGNDADHYKVYGEALAVYERQMEIWRKAQSDARIIAGGKQLLFKKELLAYLGIAENHPKADALFNLAWEEGHGNGFNEVLIHAERLVELIRDDKDQERYYATVRWHARDIKEKKPRWSLRKCEDWLADNARQIQDDMCSRGYDSIDTLLDMSK